MAIQSLLVINKSGGLIYQRNFETETDAKENNKNQLNSNDYLILASTLHSVFAISSQLTPRAIQLNNSSSNSNNTITGNTLNSDNKGLDYTIPYIPNVGMVPANSTNTTNNGAPPTSNNNSGNSGNQNKLGSFLGDDYFKESFISWNKSGLRQLSTDQFTLFIYQTMTGLKFVTVSSSVVQTSSSTPIQPTSPPNIEKSSNLQIQIADNFLRKVYCIYSDYVMKDPFYSLEMPIKSELFDRKVKHMVDNLS